jgi:hypothetical protein
MKLITYTREQIDAGPTIICMKYAKIKPEGYPISLVKHLFIRPKCCFSDMFYLIYFVCFLGKFPLTVSNTWSTTKLFINENIPEIVDFKKE